MYKSAFRGSCRTIGGDHDIPSKRPLRAVALFVVVGFIYWGAAGGGNTETASAPVTRSETTGMGGPSV
jgi:hypothetical protein